MLQGLAGLGLLRELAPLRPPWRELEGVQGAISAGRPLQRRRDDAGTTFRTSAALCFATNVLSMSTGSQLGMQGPAAQLGRATSVGRHGTAPSQA